MNMQENAEFPQGADHTRKGCFLSGPQGPNRSEIGSGWGNYLMPGSTSPVAAQSGCCRCGFAPCMCGPGHLTGQLMLAVRLSCPRIELVPVSDSVFIEPAPHLEVAAKAQRQALR